MFARKSGRKLDVVDVIPVTRVFPIHQILKQLNVASDEVPLMNLVTILEETVENCLTFGCWKQVHYNGENIF
jgi:hypothetical protein